MTDIKQEREQLEREMEERQRQIDREETMRWCQENERRRMAEAEPVVTRSAPTTRRDNQAMSQNISAEWRAYIEAANKSWVKAVTAATGEILIEERKRVAEEHAKIRAEFKAEIAQMRIEFLQAQLDEARGVKRPLRVVGDAKESMIG